MSPALRGLAYADPPYVTGVTVAETDYPVVVTGLTERGREAVDAVGDGRDAGRGGAASIPPQTAVTPSGSRFQVALSFASEQRNYVQRVASALAIAGIGYFYDEEQKIPLWGKNQAEELQRIYMDDSNTVVIFISSDYARKNWPIHERRSALSRAIRERREYILPVRFDDSMLPGLDPDISYLRANDLTPVALAEAIATNLVDLGGLVPSRPDATAGWACSTAGRARTDMSVTVVDDSRQPVEGAQVLAAARSRTYVDALADERGVATLRLPARQLLAVYAAHSAAAPGLFPGHDPANDLDVTCPDRPGSAA